MRIIKTKDYQELSKVAADIIAAQVRLKPTSVLGLATGSTPIGLYKELIRQCSEEKLDFSQVVSYNLDEYVGLSPDNDQSYRYFMDHNLFNHIDIERKNTHLLSGTAEDLEAEATAYDEAIAAVGGLDLQLLGMGNNGHIGFNEPADHFTDVTNVIDLAESTIEANSRFFSDKSQVPRRAITLGYRHIMQARLVLMVVSGEAKAETLAKVIKGEISPRVPASILRLHPNVIVVADEAALSQVGDL